MLRDLILPQSEVIRAILLEHSPCCGGCPHRQEDLARAHALAGQQRVLHNTPRGGRTQNTVSASSTG